MVAQYFAVPENIKYHANKRYLITVEDQIATFTT